MALKITVDSKNLEAAFRFPEELDKLGPEAKRRVLDRSGLQLVRLWKLAASGPRSGRRIGVVTGALRSGIRMKRVNNDVRHVGTPVPYALIHEFGGNIKRGGAVVGRMPERPHMRPALKALRPHVRRIVTKETRELVKKAGLRTKRRFRGR